MRDLFLDFETYYDSAYSLRKMTMTEYILGGKFAIHGVAAAFDDEPIQWYAGEKMNDFLADIDWANTNLICHNTVFDGAILSFIYQYTPSIYSDTMSMANYFWEGRAGLDVVAKRLGIGGKTDGLEATKGVKVGELSPEVEREFIAYAINDVDKTRKIYQLLSEHLPHRERRLIDITIRMFTQPSLTVDSDALDEYANGLTSALSDQREDTLDALEKGLAGEDFYLHEKVFSSNKRFVELLEVLGVEPPTKLRAPTKTEKEKKGFDPDVMVEVYALGKSDEGFLALLEHDNPLVRTTVEQRLAEKSRINETRARRFATISRMTGGVLPVPLKYCGASTMRWTGQDSINLQNLPSRGKDKTLRKSLQAPKGYRLVVADLSQIEPRVLAWFAGEYELLDSFASGKDIYVTMHGKVFGSDYDEMLAGYKAGDPYWSMRRNIAKAVVLGLGYGMGAKNFITYLKNMTKQVFELLEAEEIVRAYRAGVPGVSGFWRAGDEMIQVMVNGGYWETHGMLIQRNKIVLPSGNWLEYPNIRSYKVRDAKTGRIKTETRWGQYGERYTYGALQVENIVQAFARDVMGEMAAQIYEQVLLPDERIANLVHDEAVMVIREDRVDEVKQQVRRIMSTTPDYAPGLPVDCSIDDALTYGDAK
jgi:DNA polymerase